MELLKRSNVMETSEVEGVVEDGLPAEAPVQELRHRIRTVAGSRADQLVDRRRVVPLPLVRVGALELEPHLRRGRRRDRRRRPASLLSLRHGRRRRAAPARVGGPPGVGAEVDDGGRRRRSLRVARGGAPARVLAVVGDLVRRRLVPRPLHPPGGVAALLPVRAAVVEPRVLAPVDVLLPVLPPDEAVHRRAARHHLLDGLRAAAPAKPSAGSIR
jgi:hypothetical protein